jgi:uncharacterized coiled-coil protein SlyX
MEEKTVAKTSSEKSGGSAFNLNSLMSTTAIHIIMEVVTICGMGIYFSRKIAKQQKIIDELVKKIAECDENMQRHEEILEKIVARLNTDPRVVSRQPSPNVSEPVRQVSQKLPPKRIVREEESDDDVQATPLPLNLLADIMGVASGSLSNTTYNTSPSKEPVLPSIEELDSELESELQDLKEEKKE